MERVNSLSRRINWIEGVKRNNENKVMLKKEQLEIRVIEKRQLLIKGIEKEIIEKIKRSEARDDEVIKTVEEIKKVKVKVLRNDEQQIKEGLVLREGKIYILKDKNLRLEIIQLYHNILIIRHGRQ